jgi:hypothetical protein
MRYSDTSDGLLLKGSSEDTHSMVKVTTIGLELANHSFAFHGIDAGGATVLT